MLHCVAKSSALLCCRECINIILLCCVFCFSWVFFFPHWQSMEEKVTVSLVITFLFVCLFTTPPSFFIFLWCMTANMWRRWHRKWRSQGQDGCVSLEGFNVMSEQLSVSACVWSPYPPPTRLTPHTNQWLELDIWTASPVSPPPLPSDVTLPAPQPRSPLLTFWQIFCFRAKTRRLKPTGRRLKARTTSKAQ